MIPCVYRFVSTNFKFIRWNLSENHFSNFPHTNICWYSFWKLHTPRLHLFFSNSTFICSFFSLALSLLSTHTSTLSLSRSVVSALCMLFAPQTTLLFSESFVCITFFFLNSHCDWLLLLLLLYLSRALPEQLYLIVAIKRELSFSCSTTTKSVRGVLWIPIPSVQQHKIVSIHAQ